MALDLSLQVDIIDAKDLSTEDFNKKYFIPQKPLLIKGLAKEQPAGNKWTIDFFKEKCGDNIIEVFDNRNKAHEKSTSYSGDVKMKLIDFLNIIEKDEYSPYRMFVFDLYKLCPWLKDDFSCPRIFKGLLDKLGFFFMGGKDTEVRLHFDVDYNNVLLTQFYGKKKIVLIEPKYSALLYKLPFNTHSNVNLDHPDYEKHEGLAYVKGYTILQEEGDSLFMPARYWHYNVYKSGGIAVSYRKLHHNPLKNISGIISMGILMPIDKLLTKTFNDGWFDYKTRVANKNAVRAIEKFKTQTLQ
ncbi:cupin-like domain-containing protein [Lacibacter sp. H407]|uniref:cupin-like domain-containing protein n=1 Tax=Lacibacter sp. H407 TaxID=3133423 RepID=UPI0030C0F550